MNEEGLLTVADVAKMSKLSQRTIRTLIAYGELPALKMGGAIRVLETEFWAWLKTCRVRPRRQKVI